MHCYRPLLRLAVLTALLSTPVAAGAQTLYNYQVNAMGGIGGSFDGEPDSGVENTTYQLGFSMALEKSSLLGLRLGRLDLDPEEGFGSLDEAELTYFTVGGEYRARKPYYDSGIYVGLGGYRLEAISLDTFQDVDDSSLGLAVGVTAEFPLTPRFSILSELSGHVTDLDEAKFFGMLHVGFAFNF